MFVENCGVLLTARNQNDVFETLADAKQFAPMLPDFEAMKVEDPTHFEAVILGEMGTLRGHIELLFELVEARRGERVRYRGRGLIAHHRVGFDTIFDLSPVGDGTLVSWEGNFSVEGGMVLLMGSRFRALGEQNIRRLIDNLQAKLEAAVPQA